MYALLLTAQIGGKTIINFNKNIIESPKFGTFINKTYLCL